MHDCRRCPTWKVEEQQRVGWRDTAEGLKCLPTRTETLRAMEGNHSLGGRSKTKLQKYVESHIFNICSRMKMLQH